MHIRPVQPAEDATLLAIWERSVRATHTFLAEEDIAFFRPLTANILAGGSLDFWVLADEADEPIGFLGLSGNAIEALFLDPLTAGEAAAASSWRMRRSFAEARSQSTSTNRMPRRALSTRPSASR